MKAKRVLCLLLAVVMVAAIGGIMSGCGKKDPAIENAVDLGGRTIKLLSWGTVLGGVYVDPDDNSELGEIKKERLAEMEELYNCKFELELMDAGEIPNKFTTAALSGEAIADLIAVRNSSVPALLNNNLLLALDKYFDFSKPQFNKNAKTLTTVDGKVYGFSTEHTNHVENALYFNKRIFDDVGLEYPYKKVADKTWTTDVFEEYLKKATVLNNDGTTAIYGMYGFTYNGDTLPNFISCFGAEFAKRQADGSFKSGVSDPEMTAALEFIRRNMFENKYIYNVSGNASWTEGGTMFKEGKVAMIMGGVNAGGSSYTDMTDDFGVVPLPLGPGQTEYAVSEMYENLFVMPASLDDTTAQAIANMVTYIHAMPSEDEDETAELIKRSIENTFRDEESVDIAYDLLTTGDMKVYNHRIIGGFDVVGGRVNDAIHGQTTVASAIGSAASAWEIVVDSYNMRYGLGEYAE